MCGWQVKLCDPLVTQGPYLSTSEIKGSYIKRYINSPAYFLLYDAVTLTLNFWLKHSAITDMINLLTYGMRSTIDNVTWPTMLVVIFVRYNAGRQED